MGEIRQPKKKQSIEKKNKIIEKGFELICNKGFYNVTCVDIAKYSGVSTGIIYQYFSDKRDIFIAGVKNYSSSIMFPMMNVLENVKIDKGNLKNIINEMINKFVEAHSISEKAHEELMAMSYLDEEIGKIFKDYEIETTEKVVAILKNNGFQIENIDEKVHIVYGMMDNFCHEIVYHKHKMLSYDAMKEVLIDTILYILN